MKVVLVSLIIHSSNFVSSYPTKIKRKMYFVFHLNMGTILRK